MSQRTLAKAAEINPAIISRFESEDRMPSGPEQVLAIARALVLDDADTDVLLASAGYWPAALLVVGPADPTLLTVARVLSSPGLGEGERERFRAVLRLLAEQWTHPS